MQVLINRSSYELDPVASLADAIAAAGAQPPFAVALNLEFVPKSAYPATPLKGGDQIEIISPITGG